MNYEFTHISMIESSFVGHKTKRWFISPKPNGGCIGEIKWFPRWRKYCFFPWPGSVYEETCLREIAGFCVDRTKEHRAMNKEERAKQNESIK